MALVDRHPDRFAHRVLQFQNNLFHRGRVSIINVEAQRLGKHGAVRVPPDEHPNPASIGDKGGLLVDNRGLDAVGDHQANADIGLGTELEDQVINVVGNRCRLECSGFAFPLSRGVVNPRPFLDRFRTVDDESEALGDNKRRSVLKLPFPTSLAYAT